MQVTRIELVTLDSLVVRAGGIASSLFVDTAPGHCLRCDKNFSRHDLLFYIKLRSYCHAVADPKHRHQSPVLFASSLHTVGCYEARHEMA